VRNGKECASRIERSERLLEQSVARGVLTENGKAAVEAALDPFHDKPITGLRGWPDLTTQPSVIRQVKKSFTVGFEEGEDTMMIYTLPIMNNATVHTCVRRNAIVDEMIIGVSTDVHIGPVMIRAYPNADSMPLASGREVHTFGIDDDFLQDSCRLVGWGVEVHDVTAELYKQGTLTIFQVPQSTLEPETFLIRDTSEFESGHLTPTPISTFPIKKFPSSMEQVMLLEGTRQWESKKGAYIVIPFQGKDNFPGQGIYKSPALYDVSGGQEKTGALNTSALFMGQVATPIYEDQPLVFLANKFAPVDSKGILLTGQSVQSKYTVNVIWYIESFPSVDNPSLVTLARPSACIDNTALEIISCATKDLPIGVPVGDNVIGDWFAEIVSTVAPWVGAIGNTFGVPLVGAAATAAEAAANKYMSSSAYTNTGGMFAPKRPPKQRSKQPQAPSPAAAAKKSPPDRTSPVSRKEQSKRDKARARRKQDAEGRAKFNAYFG